MQSLDMLANNLANASTDGYKVDHEFYSTYIAQGIDDESESSTGEMPVMQKPWTDFSQGTIQPTGHPLDIAISGPGFFGLNGPSGPLYTRDGNFKLSNTGTLTNSAGYPVRLTGGGTLTLHSQAPIEISSSGEIRQNEKTLGQLELTDFANTRELEKAGSATFKASRKAGATPAKDVEVQQGAIETSNVVVSESAVRLVTLMRHYESLQKAINVANQMNQESITEIARINS